MQLRAGTSRSRLPHSPRGAVRPRGTALPRLITLAVSLWLTQSSPAQVNSTWNGTTGNWSDAARWSSNPLFPNNGNGGNTYNAVVNAGTVTVDQPITIEGLTFGGGTIATSSNLTLNAPFTTGIATLSGAGTFEARGGGTLNNILTLSGGAIRFGNGVTPSTVNHTSAARLLLNNGAQATVRAGTVYGLNITVANSNFGSSAGTPGAFTVEAGGILRKTGAGTHLIANNAVLNNSGTIDVTQGNLTFEASTATWTNAGEIAIAAGATVQKGTGTMNLAAGSAITGAGSFVQTAGTLNATGDNSISRLQIDGTLNRSANTITSIKSNFTSNLMTLTGPGTLEVLGGGSTSNMLIVSGGALRFGDGVTSSTFTHGTPTGLLLNDGAQATVRAGATYTVNLTGGSSNFGKSSGTGGAFNVEAGGTLRKTGSGVHLVTNAIPLNNSGTLQIDQGTVSFTGGATLNNSGTVKVNAGTLDFLVGGNFATNAGTVSVASGATIQGAVTNGPAGVLNGAGTVTGAVNLQPAGRIEAGVSGALTTLTLQSGLTMANDSIYGVKLFGTGPAAISQLAVTGAAGIDAGADFQLDLSALSPAEVQSLRDAIGVGNTRTYTVLTAAGGVAGGVSSLSSLVVSNYGSFPRGEWAFALAPSANTVGIRFTPIVPEPSAVWALAALGGLFARRRRTS
jgi:MYXO-CTERM domain-containing protein